MHNEVESRLKEKCVRRYNIAVRFIIFAIIGLSGLLGRAWADADQLIIATGGGSPYIVVDGQKIREPLPGFSIEIVKAVSEKLDWQIKFEIMPFSRQLAATESGTTDALMAVLKSDAPHFVYPSQQIGIASNCFFKRRGTNFYFPDREVPLDHYRIGVTNGFTYGLIDDYIAENNAKNIMTLSGEDNDVLPRLVKMLTDGRIDTFIEAEAVVNYYLKKHNIHSIVNAGCTSILDAYIGFSPNNPKSTSRADSFDKAVAELRSEGTIAQILAKYNVTEWR
jgi:polar amino acid transport system substrate-binding protein